MAPQQACARQDKPNLPTSTGFAACVKAACEHLMACKLQNILSRLVDVFTHFHWRAQSRQNFKTTEPQRWLVLGAARENMQELDGGDRREVLQYEDQSTGNIIASIRTTVAGVHYGTSWPEFKSSAGNKFALPLCSQETPRTQPAGRLLQAKDLNCLSAHMRLP